MKSEITMKIDELVVTYDNVVKVVDRDANEDEERAYGGVVRSVKGKLQEHLTEEIIKIAWKSIGGEDSRLSIDSHKYKIPINRDYVDQMSDQKIKDYILSNLEKYYFGLSVDKQVNIDQNFIMGIECKSYTENAMMKRILVDFSLLKTIQPKISCYLFQLESQLGGDYRDLKQVTFGSSSTHTLMSYFPEVKLQIFTFLEGERKVNKPIHRSEFFKPLEKKRIKKAISLLALDLKKYL